LSGAAGSARWAQTEALLLAALRTAPRRFRLPPLPADVPAAAASEPATAIAFALEAARVAHARRCAPAPDVPPLFTRALAELIGQALLPQHGDPGFQALVLQAGDASVDEFVRVAAARIADRRTVRATIDAIAHPGKLAGLPAGAWTQALQRLHQLAMASSWRELRRAIDQALTESGDVAGRQRAALAALLADPALLRLERGEALQQGGSVRRYRALCERRGASAGSAAAASQGRAAAHAGAAAETAAVRALDDVAAQLNRHAGTDACHVLRNLRTPAGFPGAQRHGKQEWDAAIGRRIDGGRVEIVLLAEVKSSPAAATPDLPRLMRGLQRLAEAGAAGDQVLAAADGGARVSGASLQRLQPLDTAVPANVVYCCSAAPEPDPQVLAAAAKGALLADPASLAFAQRLLGGAAPSPAELAPLWQAVTTEPRWRGTLRQFETATAVREAMLHPDDLAAAVSRALAPSGGIP
jgi:hypothetical protein